MIQRIDRAIGIVLIFLFCLWSTNCSFKPYPSQTKVKYENSDNTVDKTSSSNDTVKSGETWSVEQIFKWEDIR
tara:strand:- start:161 stop:379 length:219 start_codon:yes stop_codon:yes gene_type:complete